MIRHQNDYLRNLSPQIKIQEADFYCFYQSDLKSPAIVLDLTLCPLRNLNGIQTATFQSLHTERITWIEQRNCSSVLHCQRLSSYFPYSQETATEFWDVIDEFQNNYFVYLVCCCMLKFGFYYNLTMKWPVASNCKVRLLLYLNGIMLKYLIHLSNNRNLHTIFHQPLLSFLFLFMYTIEE